MGGIRQARARSSSVAVLVAYALLIQALFSAFVTGVSANPPVAGPLCGTHFGAALPSGKQLPLQHHLPNCCLAGCSMVSAALLPPPVTLSFHVAYDAGIAAGNPPEVEIDWRPRPRAPHLARAPPFIA